MSLDVLVSNLNQPDEAERMYAVEDLGLANDPAGIAPLCNRLAVERSRAVKEAIISALRRIHHPQVVVEAAALLQSEDVFICNQAVQLLAERGAAALPQIQRILHEGDDHLRKLALDVLGRIQAAGAEELYRLALRDPDPNIVITAVEYIGANTVRGLKPEIECAFKQAQEPMLLTAALEALCQVGDANSLNLILERFPALSAVPEMLLYSIIKAMGRLGSPRHAPRIARLLQDGPERLAHSVVDALISLRVQAPSSPWPPGLLNTLLGLLGRNIDDVLRFQILVLLWQGQPGAELRDRLQIEANRLKDAELLQGWREQTSKLGAL